MQFTVEEVQAVQPWAILNKTGNRHPLLHFATQSEAQNFANAMNEAWEKMERESVTPAIQLAEQALTPQA